ncbi:hypothetical protein FGG08_006005 [Glutinoglossum americanum]|uniref:Uncharacterized protein n=1 Tax=Glutinoglossum americanum TaxID=1670608 RepID=A0A9P8HZ78_9PEZI|nr:hypothetical protein FGG08_006005 [Glutinoglossum americanum]
MSSAPASASAVSSSIVRYRPIIILVTGLTAVCGAYYLHSQFFSSSSSHAPPQPLRRRNALHRPNRTPRERSGNQSRLTVRQLAIFVIRQFDNTTDNGEPVSYGTFLTTDEQGEQVEVPLSWPLMPFDEFLTRYGVQNEDAAIRYSELRSRFLTAFLTTTIPRDIEGTIGFAGAEGNALRNDLVRRGFLPEMVDAALRDVDNRIEEVQDGEWRPTDNSGENDGRTTTAWDNESNFSWRGGEENVNGGPSSREGQSLLNLLYHIAEDQARREGYVHRGVTCNSCGSLPIRGIRYRCANCIDFDLCETCEAMQVHPKTHLFYKVRIPAPFLGNPRQAQPVWYPGKPGAMPQNMPTSLGQRLVKETGFETPEVEALWDQFKCLASSEWMDDPNKLGMAIDRRTFDKCFVPNTTVRPPPPNLIYDRMFAFYDTNGDGLIGFEEFLRGLASLHDKSKEERMKRIFQGYDIDGDGYVDRRDFLRMFRAFYALSKELTRDMIAGMEEDVMESNGACDIIHGSQPISSAFSGAIPPGERLVPGEEKQGDANGDLQVVDREGVVRESDDDRGDRNVVIADAAEREAFPQPRTRRPWESMFMSDDPSSYTPEQAPDSSRRPRYSFGLLDGADSGVSGRQRGENGESDGDSDNNDWPPDSVTAADVESALGLPWSSVGVIQDAADRQKVMDAVRERLDEEGRRRREKARQEGLRERWRRRQFYVDEEEGAVAPEGYDDSMDSIIASLGDHEGSDSNGKPSPVGDSRPHLRSRSSSKVRFQDDLTDTDYETRSNHSTSSRSAHHSVGERWGGYEMPEAERDVGKEILYQVTQQGLNEMLDPLFKEKEDLAMESFTTREERKKAGLILGVRTVGKGKGKEKGRESPPTDLERVRTSRKLQKAIPSAFIDDSLWATFPQDPDDNGTNGEQNEDSEQSSISQDSPARADEDGHLVLADDSPVDHIIDLINSTNGLNPPILDPSILAKPLDDLLTESGYSEKSPTAPNTPPPSTTQQHPQPSSSNEVTPIPRKKPSSPTAAEKLALLSNSPQFSPQQQRYSEVTLKRFSLLDAIEREIAERGGPGRLNFAEFESAMGSARGRKLFGFVGTWIEMASF